jgi:cytochrome c553
MALDSRTTSAAETRSLRNLRLGWIALAIFVTPLLVLGCEKSLPRAGSPAEARGRDLFKTCSPCHGVNGGGDMTLRAPAIAGLPAWYLKNELTKFQGNIRGAHPDDQEGHRMRPMARTLHQPGDMDAVIAYVTKLPVVPSKHVITGGDARAGQAQYSMICVACHGPDAKGMQALSAPPLVQQQDWYLLSQLKKFKTGMRGAHPQDVTGSQMRAMSSTLQDTTAMRNVVAYIMSLSR